MTEQDFANGLVSGQLNEAAMNPCNRQMALEAIRLLDEADRLFENLSKQLDMAVAKAASAKAIFDELRSRISADLALKEEGAQGEETGGGVPLSSNPSTE